MAITDRVSALLATTSRRELDDVRVAIPRPPRGDESTPTQEYHLRVVARRDTDAKGLMRELDIPGNSYGVHGRTAEENVPDDYDWYAWCTSSADRVADVWLYGYDDSAAEVLVRNETSMAHRTAAYYWVEPSSILPTE